MGVCKDECIKLKNERIGQHIINCQGLDMEIINYENRENITVKFEDGVIVHNKSYFSFNKGSILNHYAPTIYGKGCLDNCPTKNENGETTKEYNSWHNILARCYSEKQKPRNPWYIDVEVCEEWLHYSNFLKWCHEQSNWEKVNLFKSEFSIDKDIIVKGNKVYSPERCSFVPRSINSLFVKRNKLRGDYPIGVYKVADHRFRARYGDGHGNNIDIHGFANPIDAFYCYKENRERIIKEIALEEYSKGNITEKCYIAMMNYKIEITD